MLKTMEQPTILSTPKAEGPEKDSGAFSYPDFNVRSWLGPMLLPHRHGAEVSDSEETIIQHDEVDLARISKIQGQVVIAVSDEQAINILKHHPKDAFPPE